MEGRSSFLQAGGERYEYIPALNAQQAHVQLQADRILQHASGWPETSNASEMLNQPQTLAASRASALAAGADR
jgi:ferrochelatase